MDVRDVLGISGGGGSNTTPLASPPAQHRSNVVPSSSSSSSNRSGAPSSHHAHHGSVIPRELAQLQGWNSTIIPIAPIAGPAFKAKRTAAVSWRLLPIRSSARTQLTGKPTDDLDLSHWVKIHNVPDYRFAKFNKSIKLLEYSHEEYQSYLNDPLWSRSETDRLMELCKRFDLRFIIIQDRYNEMSRLAEEQAKQQALPKIDLEKLNLAKKSLEMKQHAGESKEEMEEKIKMKENVVQVSENTMMKVEDVTMDTAVDGAAPASTTAASANGNGTILATASASASSSSTSSTLPAGPIPGVFEERTVEQLKSRFYFIQQTLTSLRNSSDPDLKKTNPLFTHPYDATHELLRKAQLQRLYQRKTEEIDEMAEIVLEHRNITADIKKIKKAEKDSRDAARGIKSGTKSRTAGPGLPGAPTSSASSTSGLAMPSNKRKQSMPMGSLPSSSTKRAPILLGELAPIPPSCDASIVIPPRANNSVFLRSAQLAHPLNCNPKQVKHLETELQQLNIRRARDLLVPTAVVCDQWDKLRVNILTLVNLQGYLRDKEVTRDELRAHTSSATHANNMNSSSSSSSSHNGAASSSPAQPASSSSAASSSLPLQPRQPDPQATANEAAPFGILPNAATSSSFSNQPNNTAIASSSASSSSMPSAASAKKKQEKRRLDGPELVEQDGKRVKK